MSDWALGKKLNSRIADVPLNHLIWLNDYKTYGEDSYVFQNKDMLHELYLDFRLSANDKQIYSEALDCVILLGKNVGEFFDTIYGIDKTVNWLQFHTLEAIADNSSAMETIINDKRLANLVFNSLQAMKVLFASQSALSFMYDNYLVATDLLANSQHLLSAAQASPHYELTSDWTAIKYLQSSARRIHYANKVFILGVSQAHSSSPDFLTRVTTLDGEISVTTDKTNGTTGLVYRINKFAETANVHPCIYGGYGDSAYTSASYMSYVKIE